MHRRPAGNRTYGIHKNNYAKHKSSLVLYSVVNKKLDLLAEDEDVSNPLLWGADDDLFACELAKESLAIDTIIGIALLKAIPIIVLLRLDKHTNYGQG